MCRQTNAVTIDDWPQYTINRWSFGAYIIYNKLRVREYVVASELKDPICHSNECQMGSFSSEATMYTTQ